MKHISTLFAKVQHIVDVSKTKEEDAKMRGERFNVFEILNLQTNETRTHSALIAYLLNPQADHGCGSLFLDLLCKQTPALDNGDRYFKEPMNNIDAHCLKSILTGGMQRYIMSFVDEIIEEKEIKNLEF